MTRSRHAIHTLDWIFEHPIFNGGSFAANAGIPDRTARRLLAALCDHGILRVMRPGNGRRGTHPRVPGLPEHRRGEGRVLTAIRVRQIVSPVIFRQIWPATRFAGHRCRIEVVHRAEGRYAPPGLLDEKKRAGR